jgi:hypothetical protein
MKKLLTLLGIVLLSSTGFGQIVINQEVITAPPYQVGDTVTVKYTVDKKTTTPRYFWLRYQYNNKALSYISTTYTQGQSAQTFYTSWTGYKFTPNSGAPATQLYAQYLLTPWAYTQSNDWNVGQLTIQRTDALIDGIIATQKYVIKDLNDYTDIHKLDLAYAIDNTSTHISSIISSGNSVSLGTVTGATSQFKVRVLFPTGYDITAHQAQLMKLKTDGSGDIDWTKPVIASKPFDSSGEAIFTSDIKVGDSLGVFVSAPLQKDWMNNIVTVSDAYKAFLGVSQTDIGGVTNFFTHPVLEKKIGLVTKAKSTFSESDSYYMFAHIMGIDVKSNAAIPTNAAPINGTANFRWYSGLLNQSWLDGIQKYRVNITSPVQLVNVVYAWGGDLDWSHSSSPTEIKSRILSGDYTNSIKGLNLNSVKSMSTNMTYSAVYEKATLSVTSKLEGGKVVLITTLTKADLAGLQVVMNYDDTKLTLDNIVFDSGSTITNFSTHNDGRLTFGSIDQIKTARIKAGIPYKLIFTPKTSITNTAGLFYFVLSDAVDIKGNKIELTIE